VSFSVANADSLFKGSTAIAAAATLAAPSTSVAADGSTFDGTQTFDWGLPFYYGRTVFTAIENQNTSAGLGPYFAF
jgi:cell division protein FtsI/penicillin-binding protein 2